MNVFDFIEDQKASVQDEKVSVDNKNAGFRDSVLLEAGVPV